MTAWKKEKRVNHRNSKNQSMENRRCFDIQHSLSPMVKLHSSVNSVMPLAITLFSTKNKKVVSQGNQNILINLGFIHSF